MSIEKMAFYMQLFSNWRILVWIDIGLCMGDEIVNDICLGSVVLSENATIDTRIILKKTLGNMILWSKCSFCAVPKVLANFFFTSSVTRDKTYFVPSY